MVKVCAWIVVCAREVAGAGNGSCPARGVGGDVGHVVEDDVGIYINANRLCHYHR